MHLYLEQQFYRINVLSLPQKHFTASRISLRLPKETSSLMMVRRQVRDTAKAANLN